MAEQILMNLTSENMASPLLTLTRMIQALGWFDYSLSDFWLD